jgi:hypothetical protein
MKKHWTIFEGGPNQRMRSEARVTINTKRNILLNLKAFQLIGSPGTVELLWDDFTRTIGIRPRDAQYANAFPVHVHGKGKLTPTGGSKYNYRTIYAAPFCRHFNVRPTKTLMFINLDLDDEGVLMLDLAKAITVGRG